MKKIKLSRRAIVILLVSIAAIVALDTLLSATGFLFVTGHSMARFESHPIIEMQVSVEDGMAAVRILNHSESQQYMFGEQFALYRRFGWRWRRVFFQNEFTEGVPWVDIGFFVPPNCYTDRWPIDLYQRFGELPSGEYRIATEVSPDFVRRTRENRIMVAGGFTIP